MSKEQAKALLLDWHKTFGIDHVFCDIASNSSAKSTQAMEVYQEPSGLEQISSIEELRKAVFAIDCPLKRMAKNTVFSDGAPGADVMIIGEAPGRDEDEQGKPFVGQSGKLLDAMLASVNIKRQDVYISNVVFWRPPGNRTPTTDETGLCLPYVARHVALARPKILLLLGGVAIRTILNTSSAISGLRRKKHEFLGVDTIVTFHPAYLLRAPTQKAVAFQDFIFLRNMLDSAQ
jgi:DNA polymerase